MKSTAALRFCVLLSLPSTLLGAPIPILEECSQYASCRPSRSISSLWSSSRLSIPQIPKSSSHSPSSISTVAELLLLKASIATEHATKIAPPKMPVLADDGGLALVRTSPLPSAPSSALPQLRAEDAARFGFGTLPTKPDCGHIRDVIESSTTFTYGYTYSKRDYTDVMVVGIVVLFLVAVVLVELLEKVVEMMAGEIRLDEEPLPRYTSERLPRYSPTKTRCPSCDYGHENV